MFNKNLNDAEQEVSELIDKFGLTDLSPEEKSALVSMASEHALVSQSKVGITQFAFEKTLVYQNWLMLSRLIKIDNKLSKS